ncbi:MAG: outer membrane beta-barrel protein, partial [Xanthobacteraceae bacterium]|nr:outer membrane beta-barrel protein [Xanthobacteraceae bacterium]
MPAQRGPRRCPRRPQPQIRQLTRSARILFTATRLTWPRHPNRPTLNPIPINMSLQGASMKSYLFAACALGALCLVASAGTSDAQSSEELLRRLEAKLDALSKENAELRARVRKIETTRQAPAAPVRVASVGTAVSDAVPPGAVSAGRAASAAYVPSKAVAVVRPGCANFGGWYAGVHGGSTTHIWNVADRNSWAENQTDLALPNNVSGTGSGYHVGVQGGWNWQAGCTLVGLETDWSWSGLKQSKTDTDGQPGLALDRLISDSELRWWGTLRTRAGVIVDRVLIYVTGGLAYASIRHSSTIIDQGVAVPTETLAATQTRLGWTAGFGTEWAWTDNWSIKGEVLYANFLDSAESYQSAKAASTGAPPTLQDSHISEAPTMLDRVELGEASDH